MPKEIELLKIKPNRQDDLSKRPVVFEYTGRISEINNFVRLAREAGLNAEMPEEDSAEGLFHFKITLLGIQLEKFIVVLHEWETDI
jgi:hypothetical protein